MRRTLIPIMLTCFFAVFGTAAAAGKQTDLKDAEAFVNGLGERTINSLSNRPEDDPERVVTVRELLSDALDIERIGRIVLGKQWRKVSKDQQKEYQKLFREYALTKYALLVSGYNGETFAITSSQKAGRRDALVFTNIQRDGKPLATVAWRITTSGDQLRVLDVKVEKISMVQTEKSQFQTILQKDGFDGLMMQIEDQLKKMQNKMAAN